MNRGLKEERIIERRKAEYSMYRECPMCGRPLEAHTFEEFGHCKNLYMGLNEDSETIDSQPLRVLQDCECD